jgi:hypothetical protein
MELLVFIKHGYVKTRWVWEDGFVERGYLADATDNWLVQPKEREWQLMKIAAQDLSLEDNAKAIVLLDKKIDAWEYLRTTGGNGSWKIPITK